MAGLFVIAVGAAVTGAYAVAVCGAEASHLPLVFYGGLEDYNPLFRLMLLRGEGAGSHASVSSGRGCGGREVGQCGLDFRILLCGGGSELVQRSVAGGGCRREGVKLAVQQLQNSLRVPSVAAGSGETRDYAVESLRRGSGSEHVRCVAGCGVLVLEGQLKGFTEFFPGVPTLAP